MANYYSQCDCGRYTDMVPCYYCLLQRVRELEAVAEAAKEYRSKCIAYECGPRNRDWGICEQCPARKLDENLVALEGGSSDGLGRAADR